jgi:hypothetical protein
MVGVLACSPDLLKSVLAAAHGSRLRAGGTSVVRYLSAHTGLPVLLVAAALVCIGYRVLRRSARFVVEIVAVTLVLSLLTRFGWIAW